MVPRISPVIPVVLFVLVTGAAVAQERSRGARATDPEIQPVTMVNLPAVQEVSGKVEIVSPFPVPVTGLELSLSQETLATLLLRMYGALPAGVESPIVNECVVVDVGELVVRRSVGERAQSANCNLATYADACAEAAALHRSDCARTCEEFTLAGGRTPCRGSSRPGIEPFASSEHCFQDPAHATVVTCTVSGWCSCTP